jgi:hypothetical protein
MVRLFITNDGIALSNFVIHSTDDHVPFTLRETYKRQALQIRIQSESKPEPEAEPEPNSDQI